MSPVALTSELHYTSVQLGKFVAYIYKTQRMSQSMLIIYRHTTHHNTLLSGSTLFTLAIPSKLATISYQHKKKEFLDLSSL